jgi:death-on-curing protein
VKILTKHQIVLLHEHLINETGGSHGLRDEGLLESALSAPFQEFQAFSPYPTIQQKAARLAYGLIMNHPFVDGNKRIGAHAMLTLLLLNGIELEYTQQDLADTILRIAAGESGYDELLAWILKHQE